ncbi:FMN-binding protein [Acetanaerobacterium elongatum]|uniref:Ion-translocating oxidoreductase complex subunit G n=1 Tax=Acetanaerobacterium elongatum TaxID=258515 RepID=A0A1G9XBY1_9FIRM|nr:FMN-binding protein [Acetanaerobacterium elongatum]SDM94254.1 electron transport complex protein RnfG [Acetanaerobacterium elongatum]
MSKNTVKEIIIPAVVLTGIALVVTALLAFTNALTLPVIEQNDKKNADLARKELLADADSFTQVQITDEWATKYGCLDAYTANNGAGAVITVTEKGYGGNFTLLVGINKDGAIVSYKALKQQETAGLGSNGFISPFADQFKGKTPGELAVVKGGAGKDNEISAMTGATITSKAVTKAVNNAGAVFTAIQKGAK